MGTGSGRLACGLAGATAATLLLLLSAAPGSAQRKPGGASFAGTVTALSEPGGFFDTDNLISNERSYLQVLPELRRRGVTGGVYVGVGPDQNFSYIAAIRPSLAYVVDVRRDNLLLHLLFKALFELSPTRAEYLALLLGRPVPPAVSGWRHAPVERLVSYFAGAPEDRSRATLRSSRITDAIRRTRVAVTDEEFRTIGGFHRRFVEAGLDLRFNSTGRPPQAHYPTYRDLLLETDSDGARTSFLASDDAFQFVKALHLRDRIIPIVGDLSGRTALQALARDVAARGETLSAFYVSNVEFYLFSHGSYPRFVANLRALPRAPHAVLIRSVFGRYASAGRPGDWSTSSVQPVDDLIRGFDGGRYRSYGEVVGR